MSAEHDKMPQPEIVATTLADLPAVRQLQVDSWKDTYEKPEVGVTEEWLEEETSSWMTPEALEKTREFFESKLGSPEHLHHIAKVDGSVVGLLHVSNVEGRQVFEALYIDKQYHGKGLAQELMQQAMDWLDLDKPTSLQVVSYNDRAISFYRKYGFEISGPGELYKGVLPGTMMTRPGGAA